MLDNLFQSPICRHLPKARNELLAEMRSYLAAKNKDTSSISNSTRRGYQSPPTFFDSKDAPILKLKEEISLAFKEYFPLLKSTMMAPGSKHSNDPFDFELWGWVTSYDHHGWNAPHIHPRSLISGVYWVETPPQILENKEGDHGGWLAFQDPRAGIMTWPLPDTLTHFFVPPEEGLLVLFPSYLSHFVAPFAGPGQRTSIAFNLRQKISDAASKA